MAKVEVQAVGDVDSFVRQFKRAGGAAKNFEGDLKQLSVSARQSASAQIAASARKDARLRGEIAVYREVASSAKRGSREQIAASNLAARAQGQLARSLGTSARESRVLSRQAAGVERQLGRSTRGVLAGSGAFRSMGRSLAFASAGYLTFAGAAHLIRTAISSASDLTEQINKSNIVFRGNERQVQSWSRRLIPSFGLTRTEALKTLATFGNMLVPMGFVRRRAAEMSERLVALAGDMASFNNASPVDTLRALQAGLAGQVRPLRQFGVFLSKDRIAAEALSSGIVKANVDMGKVADAQTKIAVAQARVAAARKKYGANSVEAASATTQLHSAERGLSKELAGNVPKLTTAQKTLATYRIILRDTADAHGDAARTGKNFAGQLRSLHAEAGDLEEGLGRALLPTTLQYVSALVDWLGKSKNQASVMRAAKGAADGLTAGLKAAAAILRPLAAGASAVASAVGGWQNALTLAAGAWAGFKVAGVVSAVAVSAANLVAAGVTESAWRAALIATGWGAFAIAAGAAAAYVLTHWQQVKDWFSGLWRFLSAGFNLAWTQIKIEALRTYLSIIEPFSHLPLGLGGWARSAKERTIAELRDLAVQAGRLGAQAGEAWTSNATKQMQAFVAWRNRTYGRTTFGERMPTPAQARKLKGAARRAGYGLGINDPGYTAAGGTGIGRPGTQLPPTPKLTTPTVQADFSLPYRLQLEQAKAEASRAQAAILRAARDTKAYLLAQIPHLKGQRLLTAYGLLGQANDTIASAVQAAADKAKQAAADAKQKLQAAIENVRSQIGELFQGPVLAPTDAQVKARLGVPGPKAATLTADLNAQVAQYRRLQRDLAILARRGAPKELLRELRAKGTEALPQIEALTKASRAQLRGFFRAFGAREVLVRRTARMDVNAEHVTIHAGTVVVHGGRGRGRGPRPVTGQRRGRYAGATA